MRNLPRYDYQLLRFDRSASRRSFLSRNILCRGYISASPHPHLEALWYAVAGVMALIQSIFYVLLAPVAVDDKGFGASIDAGFSAVKKCKQLFACFITLYLAVSLLTQLISSPQILLSSKEVRGFSACVEAQPYTVNLPRLVSKAVSTVFSPLWFLMAFVLYRESRAMDNSIGSGG